LTFTLNFFIAITPLHNHYRPRNALKAMGEEQLPECRKTPVDSKIKPDPKEKDLSGIRLAALSRAGGQKVFGKKDIKPEDKPIDGIKTTAKN
jgi:hypothetical protein